MRRLATYIAPKLPSPPAARAPKFSPPPQNGEVERQRALTAGRVAAGPARCAAVVLLNGPRTERKQATARAQRAGAQQRL